MMVTNLLELLKHQPNATFKKYELLQVFLRF